MTSKRRTGKAPSAERTGTTTPLEWVVAALGLGVVLAAIAVLLHQTTSAGDRPPTIVTEVSSVSRMGAAYRVEVRVANIGERTAGELKIEGTLGGPGGALETSDVMLDYLPPDSTRQVSLLFSRNPHGSTLTIRAVSFRDP
jgi:uncharacterized protein (TIGR02588 family)